MHHKSLDLQPRLSPQNTSKAKIQIATSSSSLRMSTPLPETTMKSGFGCRQTPPLSLCPNVHKDLIFFNSARTFKMCRKLPWFCFPSSLNLFGPSFEDCDHFWVSLFECNFWEVWLFHLGLGRWTWTKWICISKWGERNVRGKCKEIRLPESFVISAKNRTNTERTLVNNS